MTFELSKWHAKKFKALIINGIQIFFYYESHPETHRRRDQALASRREGHSYRMDEDPDRRTEG